MIFKEDNLKNIDNVVNINIDDFKKFLFIQKNLSESTVERHIQNLGVFLQYTHKSINRIDIRDIQDFLQEIKKTKTSATYKNYLSMLRIFFRDYLKKPDIINDFKFPTISVKPKILPSRDKLKTFFESLPSLKYKIIFLMLASSGLRVSELLSADIDRNNRMLIPQAHEGNTKNAWFSFYNVEAEALLKEYQGNPFETSRNTVAHVFAEVSDKTGIDISAQTLRSVFAREMSLKGIQDRYVDAFCGRIPQSVLARHYSDYSPEVLKEIYEKAGINILS